MERQNKCGCPKVLLPKYCPLRLTEESRTCNLQSAAAILVNRRLDGIRTEAVARCCELAATKADVTAEEIKIQMLGMASGQQTLMSLFRTHNENFDKRVGVNRDESTAQSYRYAYNHVARFLADKYNLTDIPFQMLNRSFIEKFDLHLRTECGGGPGTVILHTTRLRTIINNAIAEGIINSDPFPGYVPARPQNQRKFLTRKELDRIISTPLDTPKLRLMRDLFLFS